MLTTESHYDASVKKSRPYFLLHIPANLDLESILKSHGKQKFLHSYAYICHAILKGYLDNLKLGDSEDLVPSNKYVPLDSRILRRMLSRNKASEVISDMLAWGIIERKDSYRVTTASASGCCKGYRFTKQYRNKDVRWIPQHNKPLWKKLVQYRDEQRQRYLLHRGASSTTAFLSSQLLRLRFDLPAAFRHMLVLNERTVPFSAEQGRNLTSGVPPVSSADMHAVHTIPDLPPYLFHYSIHSSSPPLYPPTPPSYVVSFFDLKRLGRIHRFYESTIGEKKWEFKIDRKTGRLFTNLTDLPRMYRRHLYLESHERLMVVDVGECQPFIFSILLLERAREIWGIELPEDVSHYVDLTSRRGFYRYIMDACGVPHSQRDAFKKVIFGSIFYCSKWMAESPGNRPGALFIERFPNVYRILCELKGDGSKSELPVRLMRLESEIMLKDVCARIAGHGEDGFFIATIHDGIVTTADRAGQVKRYIEDAFWRRMGRIPTVKVEPFNYAEEALQRA